MEQSAEINEIGAALAKAHATIKNVTKDAINKHLDAKYATLGHIFDEVKPKLQAEGISVQQSVIDKVQDDDVAIVVTTQLTHKSGQWMRGTAFVPIQFGQKGLNVAQCVGLATTYARRYSLAAMVGVADCDDTDGGDQGKGGDRPKRERGSAALKGKMATRPANQTETGAVVTYGERPNDAHTKDGDLWIDTAKYPADATVYRHDGEGAIDVVTLEAQPELHKAAHLAAVAMLKLDAGAAQWSGEDLFKALGKADGADNVPEKWSEVSIGAICKVMDDIEVLPF